MRTHPCRSRLLAAVLGILAGALPALVHAGQEATGASRHVKATLVSEVESLEPGKPLWLGLRLEMEPAWHTYWLNPGDSGLPSRIQWTLPPGFEAGPIHWPQPKRFSAGLLTSYGYEHDVLLLSEIRTPATLKPGADVVLRARVAWLECKELCLPGKADLVLTLPVHAQAPPPSPRRVSLFAEARRRMPQPPGGLRFRATATARDLTLAVSGAAATPREAYFFPARTEVIEHTAEQKLTAVRDGFRLTLVRNPNGRVPETLDGMLIADGRAVLVSTPVSTGSGPSTLPRGGKWR